MNDMIVKDGISKLKKFFLEKYDREFAIFLKHGSKYTTAKFFASAVSFIAIPIYTRLLTPSDYGILAVFNSVAGIFTIIYGLQMYGSVGRYYLEKADDFPDFLGSSILILVVLIIVEGAIIWFFREAIMNFFKVPTFLFSFLLIISIFSFGYAIYGNLLIVKRKSGEYAIVSVLRAISLFLISAVLMYHLKTNKYLGRIYAQILITIVVFGYCFYKLVPQMRFNFKIEHLKYSIKYNLPAIPGALSGFILIFFDRVIINQLTTSAKTGLYSLAYNIAMALSVIFGGMFAAWVPTFFENMRDKKYTQIRTLSSRFTDIVLFFALLIAIFSNEIIHIMAPAKYYTALHLIPIIILGYVFLFVAKVYAYFTSYRKEKIIVVSMNLIIVTFINIGLNYLLIPKLGYSIASVTTAFSYFLLMFLNYLTVRYLLHENVLYLKMFLFRFISALMFFLLLYGITGFVKIQFVSFTIRVVAILIWGYFVFIKQIFLDGKLPNSFL
ncbi:MAG: oligosaccharide flippase family protein [Desulfobacteraceae bacterium]|nr:oligosaccharide flippase family protein [Desulfobacteraceae bacterium]